VEHRKISFIQQLSCRSVYRNRYQERALNHSTDVIEPALIVPPPTVVQFGCVANNTKSNFATISNGATGGNDTHRNYEFIKVVSTRKFYFNPTMCTSVIRFSRRFLYCKCVRCDKGMYWQSQHKVIYIFEERVLGQNTWLNPTSLHKVRFYAIRQNPAYQIAVSLF
jgi:hypothetical protein